MLLSRTTLRQSQSFVCSRCGHDSAQRVHRSAVKHSQLHAVLTDDLPAPTLQQVKFTLLTLAARTLKGQDVTATTCLLLGPLMCNSTMLSQSLVPDMLGPWRAAYTRLLSLFLQGRLVQWYPGHIARTERQLQEQLTMVDVVLEVRDARYTADYVSWAACAPKARPEQASAPECAAHATLHAVERQICSCAPVRRPCWHTPRSTLKLST